MTANRSLWALAGAAVLLCVLAGCMRRKETITVARDGRVNISLEYDGGQADVTEGDAMPSEASGWQVAVEESVSGTDNGEPTKEMTITGAATFGPGEPLPFTFGDPDDPYFDAYLRFPTTLTVEERPDGTYYHFYRVYDGRPWAQIEAWREMIKEFSEEQWKQLEAKEDSELTHSDWTLMIQMLATMEYVKIENFARWALQDMLAEQPPTCWAHVVSALRGVLEDLDMDHLAELMVASQADAEYSALEAEADAFEARLMETVRLTLLDQCRFSRRDYDRFMERFEWHQKRYEITEDLGDDTFEIHVEMPGVIVATNADSHDENEANWEFDGKMLRDRVAELMVTSRVTHGEGPEHDTPAAD
ncbi:MAG: hypothetical protein JSU68_13665 [Phycisphaerales bacterium]|nr:MAG: hypothetical protein JSU68_13665 [Phycisphaerales bacterium]